MWIGGMRDCPLDLAGQGQLLKQGTVKERGIKGSGRKEKKCSSCQLFLFQHCLVLCRTKVNLAEPGSPHLAYSAHISLNQVRVRDYVEGEEAGFDVHKLESVLKPSTVVMMTLRCESEE